jgi:pSer/pThr/pTyr-binding forkhead associated (FHA) protein
MPNEMHVMVRGEKPPRFEHTVRLGRVATNQIVVENEYVSSRHLEFRRTGGPEPRCTATPRRVAGRT